MNCTFSEPVNYEGNTPSSSIEAFAFKSSTCENYNLTASVSTTLSDVFIDDLNAYFNITIIGIGLILFALYFKIGTFYGNR